MDSRPITEETKERLWNTLELKMMEFSKALDELRNLSRAIDEITESMNSRGIPIDFSNLKNLLEYRMLLVILNLDLNSAIRIYCNARHQYEVIFSARQCSVIISEGIKRIFHFNNTARKESFWVRDIGKIIEMDIDNLKQEYARITQKLEIFVSNYNSDIDFKKLRDISVHYDRKDISEVYDLYTKQNIDDIFKRVASFLEVLGEMFYFTGITLIKYQEKSDDQNKRLIEQMDGLAIKLEKFNGLSIEEKSKFMNMINELKGLVIR